MAEYLVQDTDLTQVANAIRDKSGVTGNILFPDGFTEAVQNIKIGIELPEINASVLGTANDLAQNKQLIGQNGNIVYGKIPVASDGYSNFEYTDITVGEMYDIADGEKFTNPTYSYIAPTNRILYKTCTFDTATGKLILSEPLNNETSDGAEQKANYSTYRYFYGDLSDGSQDASVYRYSILDSRTSSGTVTLTTWTWTYYQQCVYFDLDVNFKSTEDVIIRNTKTGKVAISSSDFGIAKPEDVVVGKTFTSANGFKITGTHECSGGGSITLPEIADDVLGSASDLASGKQLIGADGNIIIGEATILKSGSIAHGVAVNNITVGSYYGTSTNVTIVRYKEVKPVDGVITAGVGSNTSGINEESESSSVFSSEYRYIQIDDAWYYTPATATLAVTGTYSKTIKFSGINPVFILA